MSKAKHIKHLEHSIFVEGGGEDSIADRNCRVSFAKLFGADLKEKKRMPTFIPCGGRGGVYKRFRADFRKRRPGEFIAMLIDSELPISPELIDQSDPIVVKAWEHLRQVPKEEEGMAEMVKPKKAEDYHILFMSTCMETWIIADREAMKRSFHGPIGRLPSLINIETRDRRTVQEALEIATAKCTNAYIKGRRSYHFVGELNLDTLAKHLPSFVRVRNILNDKLNTNS